MITMRSPLDSPDGNWWDEQVNRRETLWLGLSAGWAVTLFGWMLGWSAVGDQNQSGPTTRVSPEAFQEKVQAFIDNAEETDRGFVPAGTDLYIGAFQWGWEGLPVVLETGTTYKFHLSSYDVQHGFSVRQEENLSRQLSLQVLPDYEWVVEMEFDEPGTYHVVCNEFCGNGHRSMHGRFYVEE